MMFKEIHFHDTFVPDYEIHTRNGSVYQIDTKNRFFMGNDFPTPTRYMDISSVSLNQNKKEIDKSCLGDIVYIHLVSSTLKTSPIAEFYQIDPKEILCKNSKILKATTKSGSEYQIDLDHMLVTGGALKEKCVSFTAIGSSIGRNGNTRIDYKEGVDMLYPGRCLDIYVPKYGWLHTSMIENMQHIENIKAPMEQNFINYRGTFIPEENFNNLVCEQRLRDESDKEFI